MPIDLLMFPPRRLNLLPVAAFVFDLLENVGIISLLVSFPAQSAALAGFVSLVNSANTYWLHDIDDAG